MNQTRRSILGGSPRSKGQAGKNSENNAYSGTAAVAPPLTAAEDRQWATIAHFGGILGFLPSLIVYLVFRDRGPFTAQESLEALNFTVPPTVVAIIFNVLALIPGVGWIFALLAALIWLGVAIFSVLAGVQANRGEPYRYPVNLNLIKPF